MTTDEITDFKQFIEATIYQHTSNLATKTDLDEFRKDVDQKFDEVLDAVGERLNDSDARHDTSNIRIARLEKQIA